MKFALLHSLITIPLLFSLSQGCKKKKASPAVQPTPNIDQSADADPAVPPPPPVETDSFENIANDTKKAFADYQDARGDNAAANDDQAQLDELADAALSSDNAAMVESMSSPGMEFAQQELMNNGNFVVINPNASQPVADTPVEREVNKVALGVGISGGVVMMLMAAPAGYYYFKLRSEQAGIKELIEELELDNKYFAKNPPDVDELLEAQKQRAAEIREIEEDFAQGRINELTRQNRVEAVVLGERNRKEYQTLATEIQTLERQKAQLLDSAGDADLSSKSFASESAEALLKRRASYDKIIAALDPVGIYDPSKPINLEDLQRIPLEGYSQADIKNYRNFMTNQKFVLEANSQLDGRISDPLFKPKASQTNNYLLGVFRERTFLNNLLAENPLLHHMRKNNAAIDKLKSNGHFFWRDNIEPLRKFVDAYSITETDGSLRSPKTLKEKWDAYVGETVNQRKAAQPNAKEADLKKQVLKELKDVGIKPPDEALDLHLRNRYGIDMDAYGSLFASSGQKEPKVKVADLKNRVFNEFEGQNINFRKNQAIGLSQEKVNEITQKFLSKAQNRKKLATIEDQLFMQRAISEELIDTRTISKLRIKENTFYKVSIEPQITAGVTVKNDIKFVYSDSSGKTVSKSLNFNNNKYTFASAAGNIDFSLEELVAYKRFTHYMNKPDRIEALYSLGSNHAHKTENMLAALNSKIESLKSGSLKPLWDEYTEDMTIEQRKNRAAAEELDQRIDKLRSDLDAAAPNKATRDAALARGLEEVESDRLRDFDLRSRNINSADTEPLERQKSLLIDDYYERKSRFDLQFEEGGRFSELGRTPDDVKANLEARNSKLGMLKGLAGVSGFVGIIGGAAIVGTIATQQPRHTLAESGVRLSPEQILQLKAIELEKRWKRRLVYEREFAPNR